MLRSILIIVLVTAAVWAGSTDYVITETCDGGTHVRIVMMPDPDGPQRVSLAHMVPAESGGLKVDKSYIEIETTRVDLKIDTVLTAFYQTHADYRAMLGPNDTWIAYSGDRLVPMNGFMGIRLSFAHGIAFAGNINDTRYSQFALVPHTYSETSHVADSVASHIRFRLSNGVSHDKPVMVANTFMAQENGRYISNVRMIPSSPAGGAYSGPLYLPKAGDLVITEIMADPNNGVADATGEWFEVQNVSNVHLNLDGVTVRDRDGDEYRGSRSTTEEGMPVVLAPGEFAVFGNSLDPRANGGAKVHIHTRGHITLANNADEIILEVDGIGEIDRVEYDSSWTIPAGKSIELTDTTADNNVAGNWSVTALVFGHKNQRGTPGAPYNTAAVGPPLGDPGQVLGAGSLVITEIHTQPWGEDQVGEWFEVFNPLDTPVLLTDLVVEIVSESGTVNSFRIVDHVIVDARSYFVFTREDKVSKGGLPLGYAYKGTFALYNDVGTLRLRYDTIVVDEIAYNASHFAGFPDYGDAVAGPWPLASEYDGRTTALRDPGVDNNDASNWALTDRWRYNPFGSVLIGTPGQPNTEEGSLTVTGGPATINIFSSDTFRVTIAPGGDIDTQSIRLFWRQRPVFLKINATTIEADFKYSEVPWHIERNVATTAHLTARLAGDTALRFGGSWSCTVQDTSKPTPAVISTPSAGDLKITEIMVNSAGDEQDHEYIEVLNMSADKTFDLRDLGITDWEGRSRIYNRGDGSAIRLGPGQYAAIGRNHTGRFLGFPSRGSYLNQDLNFSNAGDQVVLFRLADNVTIAEVDFGSVNQDLAAAEGRSLSLIDTDLDPSKSANWINSSIPFRLLVDTSYGTPGGPNRIASRAGSVVITEVYPDPPPGGEPNAEFFEVWNPDTTGPIDLAGLILTDDSGNTVAISDRPGLIVSGGPQRSYIPAGGVFVFGNSRGASDGVDATFGAGVTSYDYANSWTLTNSSDAARLVRYRHSDSTVVTGMSYTSTSPGKSWAISSLTDSQTWVLRDPNPTVVP